MLSFKWLGLRFWLSHWDFFRVS